MAMSSNQESGGLLSEINVTPLVDVMLVLLIIFMVTAPAIIKMVKVDLPKAGGIQLAPSKGVFRIEIPANFGQEKKIRFGESVIRYDDLQANVSASERLKRELKVVIAPDKAVTYEQLCKVMGTIQSTIPNISIGLILIKGSNKIP